MNIPEISELVNQQVLATVTPETLNYIKAGAQFIYILLYLGVTWKLVTKMQQKFDEYK